MKHCIYWLIACCLMTQLQANTWQRIDQPLFRVIYPEGLEAEAERVTHYLNQYLSAHLQELPVEAPLRKIDVVLRTESHTQNASVEIFPYRSVWYNQPLTSLGLEWFDALAVHEGRHIIQLNQANDSNWMRTLGFLMGPDVATGVGLLTVPDWYLEGDATVSETTMTQGGRGRVASFDLWYRADVISNAPYSYDRTMHGTGFDRYPYLGPYVFGYYLTSYLRMNYGDDLFEQIHKRIGLWSGGTFGSEVERLTGASIETHFAQMTTELRHQWQAEMDAASLTDVSVMTEPEVDHWRSHYPIDWDNGQLWSLRADADKGFELGYWQEDVFISVHTVPARVARHYYSGAKTRAIRVHNGLFCWVQERSDRTRPHVSYGDIQCGTEQESPQWLTHQQKYSSAAITDDGFVAHRFDEQRTSALVWLSADGQEQSTIALPDGSVAYDLQPTDQGVLYVLTGTRNQNGIYVIRQQEDAPTLLVRAEGDTLRAPILTSKGLVYSSDRSGRDQVILQSNDTHPLQQTRRPFGAYFPIATETGLIFADYQTTGQQLVRIDWPAADASPFWQSFDTERAEPYVQPLLSPVDIDTPAPAFSHEQHKPWQDFWNPYQWMVSLSSERLQGRIYSRDVLDKFELTLSTGYDFEYEKAIAEVGATYQFDTGLGVKLQAMEESEKSKLAASVNWPLHQTTAKTRSQFTPSLGVSRLWDSTDDTLYLDGGATWSVWGDRAFSAAFTPSHQGAIRLRYATDSDVASAVTEQQLTLTGSHPRHGLTTSVNAQWLEEGSPLLATHPVFGKADNPERTVRSNIQYRINTGAIGASLGSWAFVRNAEFKLRLDHQWTETLSEPEVNEQRWTVGASVTPSLMLFRNSALRAWPEAAIYYEPETQEVYSSISLNFGSMAN